MAIPSGSGTEVLKRNYFLYTTAESEVTLITGVANHIYTVLSVVFTNRNASLTDIKSYLYVDYNAGGTDLYLLETPLGISESFVWNDKFVLTGTDKLHAISASSAGTAQVDIWCSYIHQDWT